MKPSEIRRLVDPKNKFYPFEIRTGSGGSYRVSSRENFWMAPDDVILMVYEAGQGVTLIDPDEVTECHRPIVKNVKEKS